MINRWLVAALMGGVLLSIQVPPNQLSSQSAVPKFGLKSLPQPADPIVSTK